MRLIIDCLTVSLPLTTTLKDTLSTEDHGIVVVHEEKRYS